MKVYHILEAKEVASSSKIYVDMDGVLADFFTEWGKLMGKENWRDIGIDQIPAALEKIKQTENFWLDLPLTKNAENLLSIIKNVKGSYNICSSPLPGDPNSEPHKREWIKKNLSFFPPEEIIITHNKTKWATQADGTPNILIDDYGKNIQAWEAAGGIGFKHKDHKFERTASAIKQHMQDPVTENFAEESNDIVRKYATQKNRPLKGQNYDLPIPPRLADAALNAVPGLEKYVIYNKKYGIIGVTLPSGEELENLQWLINQIMPYNTVDVDGKAGPATENAFIYLLYQIAYMEGEDVDPAYKENFADGKKKGKSRPGRVKRSGASCKGSVTSLRKKAKKYSGERGRMYHWCANMKSGRKKK